ncbi:MAG: hypothetical protein H6R13_3815 [Proteobacteria bacterium]|nr:hypothetical protein [Pseudomonadota bacterium]
MVRIVLLMRIVVNNTFCGNLVSVWRCGELVQCLAEGRYPATPEIDAGLAGALALFLHSPISVVADATGLADDQIGRGQRAVHPVQAFFQASIVVEKSSAMKFFVMRKQE